MRDRPNLLSIMSKNQKRRRAHRHTHSPFQPAPDLCDRQPRSHPAAPHERSARAARSDARAIHRAFRARSKGQASNAQVAERSFITPQSANEVMNAMASRNWVSREPDPTHGRIVLLQLTDEGRAVLRECEQAVKTIEKQMMEGIELDAASALQSSPRNFRAESARLDFSAPPCRLLGVFTEEFALVLSAYLILNPLHDAACGDTPHRFEANAPSCWTSTRCAARGGVAGLASRPDADLNPALPRPSDTRTVRARTCVRAGAGICRSSSKPENHAF